MVDKHMLDLADSDFTLKLFTPLIYEFIEHYFELLNRVKGTAKESEMIKFVVDQIQDFVGLFNSVDYSRIVTKYVLEHHNFDK